jgi:ubiquinone/menaquinone biosynthesis C-methylase UbiE
MIFHMSDTTRRKGMAEIHRVLKPMGRLLILDIDAIPQPASQESIPQHNLQELLPLMESSGFSKIEIAPVEFSIQGGANLAFLRANAQKS